MKGRNLERLVLNIFTILFASMFIFNISLANYTRGHEAEVSYDKLIYVAMFLSVVCIRDDFANKGSSHWIIPSAINFLVFFISIMFLVSLSLNDEVVTSLSSDPIKKTSIMLYILSIINLLIRGAPVKLSKQRILSRDMIGNALLQTLVVVVPSIMVTSLVWYLFKYESTVVNNATVFAAMFSIVVIFKMYLSKEME